MNNGYRKPEYWPENSEEKLYIQAGFVTLEDLMLRAKDMWPDSEPDEIEIGAENIQVNSLGYDLYDPADWIMFITLEYKPMEKD